MIRFRLGVILALVCLATTGCALIKVKKEHRQTLEATSIVGHVLGEFNEKGIIIVAACTTDKERTIAGYTVLHGTGEYELPVYHGSYFVFAFQDLNSNLIYDAGEPAGQHGDPKSVRATEVGVVFDIDIEISKERSKITIPHGTEISAVKPKKLYSRQAGVIIDLEDERFNQENGIKGYWEPGSFYNEFGGNIYFLEAYDPDKIPILFIHGATGTPKGWQYFVDHIDTTRYQPWFFYYPTGLRINSIAYQLFWKLVNLQTKYQFEQMHMVAHSMGGLVARSFLVDFGVQFPYVKLLISLATPWGGDHMAKLGVKQSPAVIPSWIDMQSDGDFVKSLYRKKLPETVSFYMFTGHRGSRNPFRSNNDGTIALASIMDYRSQSEAKMNYVFDEDHASIIYSKEVVDRLNFILDGFYEKQSALTPQSGGFVKVHFDYTYPLKGTRPETIFIIVPVDKKKAETVTRLWESDNDKNFGPFPPGDYYAAMVAMAAKPRKKYLFFSIENNKTEELNFVFEPDGELYGCVTAALKTKDKFVGRPDSTYQAEDEAINIQYVQLTGNKIQRTLQSMGPHHEDELFLVERKDYCTSKCFGFFGLPAGDYKLLIKAQGYQSVEKDYSVVPGVPKRFRETELTPE
jgi:pimeloyl-ACP methyl ester carboxylesterase